MEPWITHNNPAKQLWMALGVGVIGLVLIVSFQDMTFTDANRIAGLLLGILLLVIGIVMFLFSGKQTITIDPNLKLITVQDTNKFKTKRRVISFHDIVQIKIGYQGSRTTFVRFYYLILKLKSGEEYSLFAPGQFYEGGSDRTTMEQYRQRLNQYLNRQG